MSPGRMDRELTIAGTLQQASAAQQMVSDHISEMIERGGVGGSSRAAPASHLYQPMPQPPMYGQPPMGAPIYGQQYPVVPSTGNMYYPTSYQPMGVPQPPAPPGNPPSALPNGSVRGEERGTLLMVIPSSMAGRVIGKGGAGIREVQSACGVEIQVSKTDEPGPTYACDEPVRTVTVTGSTTGNIQAQYMLLLRLATSGGQANWKVNCVPISDPVGL